MVRPLHKVWMCTLCNNCFVPQDKQTGRAVNINTDTDSNDGCMNYIVKCRNALWKSKHFMQIMTQVDMVIMTHILNRKIQKIKSNLPVLCILSLLFGQRELEKYESNSESRIMQFENLDILSISLCVLWKMKTFDTERHYLLRGASSPQNKQMHIHMVCSLFGK